MENLDANFWWQSPNFEVCKIGSGAETLRGAYASSKRREMWSLTSLSSAFSCHLHLCSLHPTTIRHYQFAFSPQQPFLRPLCRLSISAAIKQHKGGKMSTPYVDDEMEDDDIEDAFEDFDEEEEEEDGGDDGELLPFNKMRRWLKSKPRGFGEEKTYDTTLEDRLLEEVEQSRKAQEANVQKLKLNPLKSTSVKQPMKSQQQQQQKGVEDFPGSVRLRVSKLPKKKNIHRDLLSVFKGFPGLLRVSPAVTGNKKTRDPTCKGFAFLDFESEATANRFVEMYSGQSIAFGKIQKQVSFDALKSEAALKSGFESAETSIRCGPRPPLKVVDMDVKIDGSIDIRSLNTEQHAIHIENFKRTTTSTEESDKEMSNTDTSDDDLVVGRQDPESSTENIKEKQITPRVATLKKHKKMQVGKPVAKRKPDNGFKLQKVPGSVSRLKIRERAVLTEIFSKYGATLPSPES